MSTDPFAPTDQEVAQLKATLAAARSVAVRLWKIASEIDDLTPPVESLVRGVWGTAPWHVSLSDPGNAVAGLPGIIRIVQRDLRNAIAEAEGYMPQGDGDDGGVVR